MSYKHESGVRLRIKLSTPHPNIPFRSGELVNGNVIISQWPDGPETAKIQSLGLKVYFESRTLFWHFAPVQPKTDFSRAKRKITPSNVQEFENTIAHEVHAGFVPNENVEVSWEGMTLRLDGSDENTMLPFSFTVPPRMRVTKWNEYRNAPRDLCHVERSPPPSFPDSSVASVQWIVEAVLHLEGSEKVEVDERMFKLPNPSTIVTRLVFPFLPADHDAQDLSLVPFYGKDLRIDSFGAVITWEGDAGDTKSLPKGTYGRWKTYQKFYPRCG
jgi:hypothetical protein